MRRDYTVPTRVLLEFVVIVAGVLTALAVDQWRQSREEHVQEQELLRSLEADLATDSMDFARLPSKALGRVRAAEVLIRTFRPDLPRTRRAVTAADTLGPYPESASDEQLVEAFADLAVPSDFDVARGAYREFSEGGGQRLVRDPEIRRMVHGYHYVLTANLKFDPWVTESLKEVRRRANDLGLSGRGNAAGVIRERLASPEADPFFAALQTLQYDSHGQVSLAAKMLAHGTSVRSRLREALDE